MDARPRERHLLGLGLRRAVAAGEIEMHHRPPVNLRTRRRTGFEASARRRHPGRGMVPPARFIPMAEGIGLIGAHGGRVLRRARTEAASWPDRSKVAADVFATQSRAGCDLAGSVAGTLAASGLAPDRLEVEVTEAAVPHDTGDTLAR